MNRLAIVFFSVFWGISSASFAVNECRIKYQTNDGKGKRAVRYLSLNEGQTKAVNHANIDYVKNLKLNAVKLTNYNLGLRQRYNYQIEHNAQDPAVGFHVAPIKLEKVQCLRQQATGTPLDVARQMVSSGKTAFQIATHLKNVVGLNAQKTAQTMKQAGFSLTDVIVVLKNVFSLSAVRVTNIIKTMWSVSKLQLVNLLDTAGFSLQNIVLALKDSMNATPQQAAQTLWQALRSSLQAIAQAMRGAGYSLVDTTRGLIVINANPAQVAEALKTVWNPTADVLGRTFKTVGYSVSQTKTALSQAFSLTGDNLRRFLLRIGYSATEVASVFTNDSRSSTTTRANKTYTKPIAPLSPKR